MSQKSATTETVGDRIAFAEDEEAGPGHARAVRPDWLRRERSSGSLSIRPAPRRNSLDAAAAVPIQYRALSIDVEEAQRAPQTKAKPTVLDLANLTWHTLSPDELAMQLSTSVRDGLSADQAARRTQQYGANVPSAPPTHRVRTVLGCFFREFGPVLLVAGVLVFVSWKPLGRPPQVANLALAIVLLAIFMLQGAFNLWQDWSSARVMASIHTMLPDACLVVRDGSVASIPAAALVPGDVLLVRAGNRLSADVRFVDASSDAKFDRGLLTGESRPLAATAASAEANYLETACIGLQGTHCVSGTCRGVVVATGDRTVFGRIAGLTNTPKTGMTTLEREIFDFTVLLCSFMAVIIVAVLIIWGAWLHKRHRDWISVPNLIVSCVSIVVAFLPEGMPVALTASMTIGANTMRRNRILCKSLKTVETLGAVSIVCSDKTGTLTQNKMVVTACAQGSTARSADEATAAITPASLALQQLRAVAGLCNEGQFDAATNDRPLHERTIHGDATDQAVLRFSESLGPVADLRRAWTTRFTLPFNSKNKYMLRTLTPAHPDGIAMALLPNDDDAAAAAVRAGATLLMIKGAPEILLERAAFYVHPVSGTTVPLDAGVRASIEATKDAWSAMGRRVLLLARKTVPPQTTTTATAPDDEAEMQRQARTGLTLVGLVGLVDPPRPESAGVVRTLRGAGIRVYMVTGDYALTARAIAAACGILSPGMPVDGVADLGRGVNPDIELSNDSRSHNGRALVVSGPELLALDDAQWAALARYEALVFARTTPEQKLRIVRALQAKDHVVGMTGDGVNDAPALRAADIGIAMGSGSDMAVEAADMVLLDSSFAGIVEALRCGRTLFDNLRKTLAYLLPAGSFGELWPVLTNVAFGLPQILSSFLMIVLCLFTDAAAAVALAYEAPEADVLTRPPRVPSHDRLVNSRLMLQAYGFVGLLETLCSFAMAYWYLQRRGIPFFGALWFRFGAVPDGLDAAAYADALNVASSIYFVTLVVMQWFSLFAMRTRRLSILQHPPLFRRTTKNPYLFAAILFTIAMVFFWLYVPAFQSSLGNRPVPVEHWFLPMAFGLGILLLDEARKYFVRKYPAGVLARIAW